MKKSGSYKEIFGLFSSENDYILDKMNNTDFSIFGLHSSGTLLDLSDKKNITYKKVSKNQPTKRLVVVSNKLPNTPRKKTRTKSLLNFTGSV